MTTFKGLIVFFGVILTVSSLNAAELVTDGSTPTTIDQAPNGVPIVNIAGPNNSGLSHNRFQQFNVGASGLILNNANSTTASTQLGGQILGNSQLALPARVILNEVTSTNRSRLNGYTEVGGHAADIVIANPNGISVNGAGFINAPRVTLTTGIPLINGAGLLEGFNVTRGEISVEDDGLDSSAQDATSIYSHYLKLNAAVHARDLDVVLGNNAIDYPGRKASRINPASSNRVLLDSTALGGIYANKITLVGTAQGLGMNLPPEVIAATGAIEISADGRIQLQRLKAAGDIAVRSNQSIVSSDTVFGETTVALAATESITVEAGLIAASESIAISAASFDNQGTILAGVDADSDLNNHGQLEIEATTVENRGDITATRSIDVNSEGLNNRGLFHAGNRLSIKSASLTNQETLYSASDTDIEVGGGLINQGLINANNSLSITSDSLTNLDSLSSGSDLQIEVNGSLINQGLINAGDELTIAGEILDNQTTLFSSGDMALWVRDTLTNAPDASILAANNLTLAGDADLSKTDHIINDLGLIQTLQGDISVYATRFDNIGEANIDFKTFYFDIGNSEEITSVADAQTINLAYSTGFFTEIKKARLDWVVEVQRRLKLQAPDLYDANSDSIGNINILAADFIAIETRIEDYSVTRPAYLDSGGELFLHVDNFDNRNSVVAAVGNIIFDVANDYRNLAESETVSVTNYRYRTSAQHSEKTSWGKDKDKYSSEGYSGYFTVSSTQKVSANTVTQAGGSIIGTIGGNVANNGVRTGDSYQSSNSIDPRASTQTEIQIPDNNFGLFVLSQNPTSNYLIETNPQFTNFENLVNSSYLLERLDFSANETLRRLGDGFYESNLIRETVFAQTGRRYLSAKIKNDTQQFQFLMDNALLAQADLELTPGVALTKEQINRLTGDIVWLEPVIIAGESLLVPRVYLASSRDSTIQGGKIIAGESINQQIASLDNSGLLEAADDLFIDADKGIFNDGGGIVANGDIALTATDDIGNISGVIRGNNVSLHSIDGSIINRRDSTEYQLSSTRFDYSTTLTGEAGRIRASNQLSLQAADEIRIEGSDLHGSQINLEADSVTITTTEIAESLYAGDHKNFHQVDANRHLVSTIVGDDIVILSNGKTELTAAQLSASNELRIEAGDIEINTVQESRFQASKSSNKSTFSSSVEENRSFRAYNQGSQLAAASIYLVTDQGDIKITGSTLVADNTIDLASAGNIRIVSGAKDSLDESYRHKSGWFSGGSLFEEAEDLEGRISRVAVNSQIHAGEIIMAAADDMELIGVDASASDSFNLAADNIIISHAVNEETQYEKHTRISVGLGDIAANLADIGNLVKTEDGQLSLSLLSADYAHATETHTQSNAVVSLIQAGNISMTATQSEPGTGDILIRGSDLIATDAITLEASGDVAILDGLHVQSSETLNRDGSMDLNLTAKNEYVQVAQSIDALRTAEDDLSQARHDYDRYREDLALQEAHLIDMQRQFADNEGYIEQSDIDDFQRQLDRMRDDGDFYQTNIALATVTLGSQTTALIQQTAKAAASSGTWGFNVGLELDVDLLEQQVNSYYQQSLASNLSANSIVIKAGNTATVRGSNLLADELIDIDASNINLLAAASHSNSDESQQQIEGSYSWDMYGGDAANAANAANSNSAFLAANGSSRSSETIEYVNSQLLANNIRLNANEDINAEGATVHADQRLEISAQNLNGVSVQNISYSQSQSQGISHSGGGDPINGSGINASNGRSETVTTLLTSLTGAEVDIRISDHTNVHGALIAAIDADGNDNGQLTFVTNTLSASSLNNTVASNNHAAGINAGQTASLTHSNDRANERTKTLATIGSGDIEIIDQENSDTRWLNTNISETEVAIYNIESHQGLSGELDTRLLSESGRDQIAEDLIKTGMIVNTIGLSATTDKVGIGDFFSETEKHNNTYEAVKETVAADPVLAAALQDPNRSAEQKELMLNQVTDAVMLKLGYQTYDNNIIATEEPGRDGEQVFGFYSLETGEAYINDRYIDDTTGLITTAGHEATRAMDAQDKVDFDENREDRTAYAENFGSNLASYTDMALDISGYDGGMASSNNHVGNNSPTVTNNNATFANLDKTQGDNYLNHNDKLEYVRLSNALENCRYNGDCSKEEFDQLFNERVELIIKDQQSNEQLAAACSGSTISDACRAEAAKLNDAFRTYVNLPDRSSPFNDGTSSEYTRIGTNVAMLGSAAMEENTKIATVNIALDTAKGAVDLIVIGSSALGGNEAAREQVGIIYDGIKEFVADPANAIEQGIKDRMAEADRLEAMGDINAADHIRAGVYIEGAFSIVGLAGGAVALIRGGLRTPNRKSTIENPVHSSEVDVNLADIDIIGHTPLLPNPARNALTGQLDPNYYPPESPNHPIVSYPAPNDMNVNMAVHINQLDPSTGQLHLDRVGGFTTKDDIVHVDQAHNELAIKTPDWGPPKTHSQTLQIREGTRIQESITGIQIGLDGRIYPGGSNQQQLLIPSTERGSAIKPIGKANPIPNINNTIDE